MGNQDHAIRRAAERYRIDLAPADLRRLERAVAAQDRRRARVVVDLQGSRRAVLVLHHERWMLAVVGRSGRILTFLRLGTEFTTDGRQVFEGMGPPGGSYGEDETIHGRADHG